MLARAGRAPRGALVRTSSRRRSPRRGGRPQPPRRPAAHRVALAEQNGPPWRPAAHRVAVGEQNSPSCRPCARRVAVGEQNGLPRPAAAARVAVAEQNDRLAGRKPRCVRSGRHLVQAPRPNPRDVRPGRHGRRPGCPNPRDVRSGRHGRRPGCPNPRDVRSGRRAGRSRGVRCDLDRAASSAPLHPATAHGRPSRARSAERRSFRRAASGQPEWRPVNPSGVRSARSSRRADLARTRLAEEGEGVEARVVAVAPGGLDGVLTDQGDVDELDLGGAEGRVRVQPAGQARLAAAVGTGAEPAERLGVVGGPVTVSPDDGERPCRPVGMDPQRSSRGSAGCLGRRGGGPSGVWWCGHDRHSRARAAVPGWVASSGAKPRGGGRFRVRAPAPGRDVAGRLASPGPEGAAARQTRDETWRVGSPALASQARDPRHPRSPVFEAGHCARARPRGALCAPRAPCPARPVPRAPQAPRRFVCPARPAPRPGPSADGPHHGRALSCRP
jgi:hypothetical protein